MKFRFSLFTMLTLVSALSLAQAQTPAADAKQISKGKRLFLQCQSCHEITEPSSIVKIGPNLKGVFGRPVASYPGFQYSKSLKALSFNWDDANLDRWLQQPSALAADTAMGFAGLPNADDRQAMIAYLHTLK